MKLNKFDYVIMSILAVVLIFTISFNVAVKVFGQKSSGNIENVEHADKLTSAKTVEKILSKETSIVLKLQNKNNELSSKIVSLKEVENFLTGDLTLSKVKNYYEAKNYKFLQEGEQGIVFLKEIKFTPQKYYLGATNKDFVAIFKCNDEGVLFIEDPDNDISNRTLETLPETDREYLQKFEYEYNTKEEAQDELMALCS